jgi:hypothetical protein
MEWIFRFMVLWVGVSLVVLATGWYISNVIPRLWPAWWRRVVVDIEPETYFKSKQ